MADYTFLEYSYNPTVSETSETKIYDRLMALGFYCQAFHDTHPHSLWTQRQVILSIRQANVLMPGITGVGFNLSSEEQERRPLDIFFNPETDMYEAEDSEGMRILAMPDELDLAEYNYSRATAQPEPKQTGLEYVSGFVYNTTPDICDQWQELGFTYQNSERNSMVSGNRRLSILTRNSIHEQRVPTIVVDTHDVFDTTVKMLVAGIDTLQVPIEEDLDFGEELNYKIRAYNCTAIGNENSYSIEQFVPGALPGMDMIVRMRKRYMSLAEYPLEKFYAEDI
jgi:hypothetical protein